MTLWWQNSVGKEGVNSKKIGKIHQNFKSTKLKKKKRKKLREKKKREKKCIKWMHLGHGDYDEYEWGLKH